MQRTQIYLDKDEKDKLMEAARKKGVTMAEVIREAVGEYLVKVQRTVLDNLRESQGLWRDRADIKDSDKYVAEIRKRWLPGKEDK